MIHSRQFGNRYGAGEKKNLTFIQQDIQRQIEPGQRKKIAVVVPMQIYKLLLFERMLLWEQGLSLCQADEVGHVELFEKNQHSLEEFNWVLFKLRVH